MYDCLIVGGGVVGLSLAYDLAKHGIRVQVVDQREPGKEASWAGAGILPPANRQTAHHALDQLRGLSYELHATWAKELRETTGIDNGFRRCGGVYLARSAGEAASLRGMVGWLREEQIAVQELSAAALAELEPALAHLAAAGQPEACFLLPDECQLRNPRHLQALQAACRQLGVQITGQTQVQGFHTVNGTLKQVHTNRGTWSVARVCITCGAWTQQLLRQLDIPNAILPIRGQMLLFSLPEPRLQRVINEGPRYLVPRDDGHVLVGSTEEEVGFDKQTTHEGRAELAEFARHLVPQLNAGRLVRAWAGLRPGSLDGFPYLGAIPGLDNAWSAAGHFRSGLLLSTGTAVVMSQLIRGETPLVNLAPFSLSRG